MKTEKTMKAKKITFVSIAVIIAIVAITLMAVFIPKHTIASASTGKDGATSQVDKIMTQIDSLEEEYQKAFDGNAELWEKYFAEFQKMDEIPNDFDEKTFINGLTTLTADEKVALIKNVELLDELDAKLEKLYGELFDIDEDTLYGDCAGGNCGASDGSCGGELLFNECDENFFGDDFGKLCDEAEQMNDQVQALRKEFDDVMNARAELWDKVYASYDELDENFDYANFDEANYIKGLSVLSADEKDALLKDIAKLDEISEKLISLCGANCGK